MNSKRRQSVIKTGITHSSKTLVEQARKSNLPALASRGSRTLKRIVTLQNHRSCNSWVKILRVPVKDIGVQRRKC